MNLDHPMSILREVLRFFIAFQKGVGYGSKFYNPFFFCKRKKDAHGARSLSVCPPIKSPFGFIGKKLSSIILISFHLKTEIVQNFWSNDLVLFLE